MLLANSSVAIAISIAAIVIASIGMVIVVSSMDSSDVLESEENYVPQTRDIYLFTMVDEDIDEEGQGIPPDMYSQDTIVAKQGDTVRIHFYNVEPVETQEHHTFTINDPAYKTHNDINAGDDTVIEFTASKAGVFEYFCTFHQPTMRGEFVVLPADD